MTAFSSLAYVLETKAPTGKFYICLQARHASLTVLHRRWDGACLPLGLGLSLVLNGIFFARPLNEMKLLTLPDLFARKVYLGSQALERTSGQTQEPHRHSARAC